ncbi:YchJ family protein [Kitasatospora nipponensis]
MARRTARPRPPRPTAATAATATTAGSTPTACPCGLPAGYADCCGRLHRGEATAATPEQLMRSRYSAFAVRDAEYLLRSWHPDTRPATVDFAPDLHWVRLEILGSTGGSAFHPEGTVEFRAHYREAGGPGTMHENSRFLRHQGAWVYLDGTVSDD